MKSALQQLKSFNLTTKEATKIAAVLSSAGYIYEDRVFTRHMPIDKIEHIMNPEIVRSIKRNWDMQSDQIFQFYRKFWDYENQKHEETKYQLLQQFNSILNIFSMKRIEIAIEVLFNDYSLVKHDIESVLKLYF